ncbi:hypothetical protein SH661x_001602 [Planctomicrobium sp. SH661]|uniref:hypothetical protein n=1 Tax=Planctomicrobium sp. SH661 TaxID=3448124 RepID=UPI003F5BEFC1
MIRLSMSACLVMVLVVSGSARADWPFFANDGGPRRGSPEYYQLHANDPPGARQVYKYGKLWPPQPRPVGPHQLWAQKYHHAHYWPYPYTCQDEASVRAFQDTQVANGWLSQTTFYDYHFDLQTNQLNSSGQDHLRWILVHVPPEYQQISVAISADASKNSARIANVQRDIAQMAGGNPGLQVAARLADPTGRPAAEVQSIFKSAQENMPPPILPPDAGDAGGSETN